jgi:hypothetical protein
MEINITHMMKDRFKMPMLSGSVAELGSGAAKFTWRNAVDYGRQHPLLKTADDRDEARDWLKGFGAWSREEIAAWSDAELDGLVCQFIAGDIREMDAFKTTEAYLEASEQGTVSGRIYHGDDGQWFFYLGD